MLAELRQLLGAVAPQLADGIEILDVDADATLLRRYGLKVPVLLFDGEAVCHGHFDGAELGRLLRARSFAGI